MRGMRCDRAITARELVLPLRSRFDTLESVTNRIVDRLVITDLEMQEGPLLQRAPMATVDRVVAEKIDARPRCSRRPCEP